MGVSGWHARRRYARRRTAPRSERRCQCAPLYRDHHRTRIPLYWQGRGGLMRLWWALPIMLFAGTVPISLFFLFMQPTPIVSFRVDLATLIFLAGLSFTLLGIGYGVLQWHS